MNGSQDTATVVEPEIIGDTKASGSGSSSSVSDGGQLVIQGEKRPIRTNLLVAPKFLGFDGWLALYILKAWGGNRWFPGVDKAPVNWTNGAVQALDEELNPFGVVLLGTGARGDLRAIFNPPMESEDEEELSIAARAFKRIELGEDEWKLLRRLIKDAVDSRVRSLPESTFPKLMALHPDFGSGSQDFGDWVIVAIRAMLYQEKMKLDIQHPPARWTGDNPPKEWTVLNFLASWRQQRQDISTEVFGEMEKVIAASLTNWQDRPTEIASICHSLQVSGKDAQATYAWLEQGFNALAEHLVGFRSEKERLAGLPAMEIEAVRRAGRPNEEKKMLKFMAATGCNWQTASAAFDLGYDIVLSHRSDGGWGVFMKIATTRGFSPKIVVRMVRAYLLAKKGKLQQARIDYDGPLGCEGEYPGLEGLNYLAPQKSVVNGTRKVRAEKLDISFETLTDIVKNGMSVEKSQRWNRSMLRSMLRNRQINRVVDEF